MEASTDKKRKEEGASAHGGGVKFPAGLNRSRLVPNSRAARCSGREGGDVVPRGEGNVEGGWRR